MGNIGMCKCVNEYVDLEKNEISEESNYIKNKLEKMNKNSKIKKKNEINEVLISTKKIVENIYLMSEENKNLIKKGIINILKELFDKNRLNTKLTIINDILNGENIENEKKNCISLLKLIYRRKNEIKENTISLFIKKLYMALKETNNDEIIKKNEVDLFIRNLEIMFNINIEKEIHNVKFERISTNNEKSDNDFEYDITSDNNFLNEDDLKYFK